VKFVFRLLLLCVVAVPLAGAALVWFALSDEPLIVGATKLAHEDVARARAILRQHNPRKLADGATRTVTIDEKDLNLAGNYLLQKAGRGGARIIVLPGAIDVAATLRLRRVPVRPYVNVIMSIEDRRNRPYINNVRIGELPVPEVVAEVIVREALARVYKTKRFKLASEFIQDLHLDRGEVHVTYQWRAGLLDEVRSAVLSTADREALSVYYDHLVAMAEDGSGARMSITQVLQSMFELALDRSQKGDSVAENKALLLVLGSWASGRGMDTIVPGAADGPAPFRVSLDGRYDFAQHFLTSAALAAGGDTALSDAVGLFKEISDADTGSGFSFTDLAADRAGTRFGEVATASRIAANNLQIILSVGVSETDIMPSAKDLPERMTQAEFERRFGGVGGAAYREVLQEIERRVSACPLYRG
jgi:hypothetical protein